MIRIREATEEELRPHARTGYETWGAVLEEALAFPNAQRTTHNSSDDSPLGSAHNTQRSKPDSIPSPVTSHAVSAVGQIFLSRALGNVFGHDTWCTSKDPTGALRLWLRARKKAREWGAKEVFIHFEDDLSMLHFWEKRGFRKAMTIYRGPI